MEVQRENGVNVLSDSDEMRNESDQIVSEVFAKLGCGVSVEDEAVKIGLICLNQSCRYEKQEKMRRLIEERVNQRLPDEFKGQNHIKRLLKVSDVVQEFV